MAQLKIVWSKEAQDNFQQIALFYYQRTGNAKYSNRLYRMMRDSLRLAARYPYMYPATSIQETRAFVCEYFNLITKTALSNNRKSYVLKFLTLSALDGLCPCSLT